MKHDHVNRRTFLAALGLSIAYSRFSWSEDSVAPVSDEASQKWIDDWTEVAASGHIFQHWTPELGDQWSWYRLERFVDEQWKTVGITLPMHRESGEAFDPPDDYLPLDKVPEYVLSESIPPLPADLEVGLRPSLYSPETAESHTADSTIRARDGKPPSEWLRSLRAGELRDWLPTIQPVEASVRGMTCWVHLIRDHGFDPRRIEGLSEREFTLLHSAAHEGY